MKFRKLPGPLLGILILLTVANAVAYSQTPLLQYTFDDTGTSAASTGSITVPLTLQNASGVATDLHSAGGLGVSGLPGDRAFDNTGSTGMGSQGIGGVGLLAPRTLPVLDSFTFTIWVGVASEIDFSARFLTAGSLNIEAAGIRTSTAGEIGMFVNSTSGAEAISPIDYTLTNQWMFIAVSYDGTKTTNNVTFYEGSKTTPVAQVGRVLTYNQGSASAGSNTLGVGNDSTTTNARPMDGYIDDLRLYASSTDGSGVLTQTQLEGVRQADIQDVPEPSACVMLVLVGSVAALVLLHGRTAARLA